MNLGSAAAAAALGAAILLAGAGDAEACTSCASVEAVLPRPRAIWQTVTGRTTLGCPSTFYAIPLARGEALEVSFCSPGNARYDSRLKLRSPSCVVLVDNDDFCGLSSHFLVASVPESGVFLIEACGFTTGSVGDYVLAWRGSGEGTSPDECSNGIDDDGDGLTDCEEGGCTDDPACPERCTDGVDDDADLLVDCADPECSDDAACPEDCDNGADDDANGRSDCADPECRDVAPCLESGACDDGLDNDLDGWADCADSECVGTPGCERIIRPEETADVHVARDGDDLRFRFATLDRDMAGMPDRGIGWTLHRADRPSFLPGIDADALVVATGPDWSQPVDRGAATDGAFHCYLITEQGLSGRQGNSRPPRVTTPILASSWTPSGTIRLSWTRSQPSSDVAYYTVYRGDAPLAYVDAFTGVMLPTFETSAVDADTWHHFAVTATDRRGNETEPSNEEVEAILGTGTFHAISDAPLALLGPGADFGWEWRGRVDLPSLPWTSIVATLTLDSPLGPSCGCSGTGACGGDEASRPVTVFAVTDDGCLGSDDSCLSWDGPQLELLRAATPMGTDARTGPRVLRQDVTPFAAALTWSSVIGVSLPTWSFEGWRVSVDLTCSTDPASASAEPPADGVAPLFAREGVTSDNQGYASPMRVTIPAGVARVTARTWTSGHGDADAGGRPECAGAADEFCRKIHRILVDGREAWSSEIWRGCAADCADWNACGAGTCGLSRAGWCPGELTCLTGACDPDVDLTAFLTPGTHDVEYVIEDPSPGGEWGYGVTLFWRF